MKSALGLLFVMVLMRYIFHSFIYIYSKELDLQHFFNITDKRQRD